jgi:ribosome maturation factor RimP
MLELSKIEKVAADVAGAGAGDLYVVEVKMAPGNVVEVVIDSDRAVTIDDCVALSRAINEAFDRDEEDYELTVCSAGVGQPLKVHRQYLKLIGRPVEVLLASGTKIVAELRTATPEAITLAWEERVAVEGKKRKETVERVEEYPLADVKWVKEWLDFK